MKYLVAFLLVAPCWGAGGNIPSSYNTEVVISSVIITPQSGGEVFIRMKDGHVIQEDCPKLNGHFWNQPKLVKFEGETIYTYVRICPVCKAQQQRYPSEKEWTNDDGTRGK